MISTKGRYALRVMLDLSEHLEEGKVPLKDIAQRQEISKKYLEIIMKDLVQGGFVTAVSGKGVGYQLCRLPEDYPIGEILEYMEGTLAPVACRRKEAEPCQRAALCKTLPLWIEYDELVQQFFYQRTLADLM